MGEGEDRSETVSGALHLCSLLNLMVKKKRSLSWDIFVLDEGMTKRD